MSSRSTGDRESGFPGESVIPINAVRSITTSGKEICGKQIPLVEVSGIF
jgi:hypothetical protein